MTGDQLGGVIRALLTTFSGSLVTHGYISSSQSEQIIGALATLFVAGWSIYTNHPDKLK